MKSIGNITRNFTLVAFLVFGNVQAETPHSEKEEQGPRQPIEHHLNMKDAVKRDDDYGLEEFYEDAENFRKKQSLLTSALACVMSEVIPDIDCDENRYNLDQLPRQGLEQ